MHLKVLQILLCASTLLLSGLAAAASVSISHVVGPQENLFHAGNPGADGDLWHWYDGTFRPDLRGLGQAPQAVDFDFAAYDYIDVVASGCVRDDGVNFTNPDGSFCPQPGQTEQQTVGSLIGVQGSGDTVNDYTDYVWYTLLGVWSDDPNRISFVTGSDSRSPLDAVFEVGFGGRFQVPDLPLGSTGMYLFLANFDGSYNAGFSDNAGAYYVDITAVPVPGTAALFGLGLALLGLTRRLVR